MSQGQAATVPIERRRGDRLDPSPSLPGYIVELDAAVTLVNISAGGFLIRSSVELAVGETATFRVQPVNGPQQVVRARAVHAMRAATGEAVTFDVGWEFLP